MGHARDRARPTSGESPPTRATVPARAALAGNPSDGHGGAVVAVPVRRFVAAVTVAPAAGRTRARAQDPELVALVGAARAAATRLVGTPADVLDDLSVDVRTTIPRSLGLAGSSAVIIGTLRALAAHQPAAPWSRDLTRPDVLAVVAQSAEVDELGIAAGLQDRLTQAYDRPLLMDFDEASAVTVLGRPAGRVHELANPPGRFVLAHRPDTSTPSDTVHRGLGQRSNTSTTIAGLASAARDAADAIRNGSVDALGVAMDRTFDLRAELLDLDRRHVEMVEAARRAGGHANYTGSGGSVIVACPDRPTERAVTAALGELDGCIVTPSPFEDAAVSHPDAWMEDVSDPTATTD